MISLLTLGLSLSSCILSVHAFEVTTSDARQCNWMNIRVSGGDARTPYRALIVPLSPLPLSNAAGRTYEVPFDGPLYYSIDAYIRYPVGTEVLTLVGDANGQYASSRGQFVQPTIPDSNTSSCLDSSPLKPSFTFSITGLIQCEEANILWDESEVSGTPTFLVIIPQNGQLFTIPIDSNLIDRDHGSIRAISWWPPIAAETYVIIIAGDQRGNAVGGAMYMRVAPSTNKDTYTGSCPQPTKTMGFVYPTGLRVSGTTGSKLNFKQGIGIGLSIGIALLFVTLATLWFCRPHRRYQKKDSETQTRTGQLAFRYETTRREPQDGRA